MATKMRDISFAEMRSAMIDSQLRTNDVTNGAVVAAMGAVAREEFVPASLAGVAYNDRALSIGRGRAINAPLVIGRLLVAAELTPGQPVLLIGGASGYTAALLAQLGVQVVAVESDGELIAAASSKAKVARWVEGPLDAGAADGAPYDRIIIDGAVEQIPAALIDQLADGGRLVAGLIDGAVTRLVQGVKVDDTLTLRPFADMDAAPLPGFARPAGFAF